MLLSYILIMDLSAIEHGVIVQQLIRLREKRAMKLHADHLPLTRASTRDSALSLAGMRAQNIRP